MEITKYACNNCEKEVVDKGKKKGWITIKYLELSYGYYKKHNDCEGSWTRCYNDLDFCDNECFIKYVNDKI